MPSLKKKSKNIGNLKITQPQAVIIAAIITAAIGGFFTLKASVAPIEIQISATQTAEARLTSILPSLTSIVVITPTFAPTITSPALLLPSSEITFTPTNTEASTPLPTPDIHLGIDSGCIDKNFWIPYGGEEIKANSNSCLQLSDWGFFAQDKVLYFLPPRNHANQSHGLYTSLSGNVDIDFNFRVEKIQTGTSQAAIRFGIAPANISNGKFLTYHFLPEYPDFLYPKLWQDGHYGDPFPISLNKGKTQKVTISIQDNFLTIFLDNQKVVENMVLPFDERLFLIDYYLPSDGELSANISEFSIQKK